jgi:hypothetical protein
VRSRARGWVGGRSRENLRAHGRRRGPRPHETRAATAPRRAEQSTGWVCRRAAAATARAATAPRRLGIDTTAPGPVSAAPRHLRRRRRRTCMGQIKPGIASRRVCPRRRPVAVKATAPSRAQGGARGCGLWGPSAAYDDGMTQVVTDTPPVTPHTARLLLHTSLRSTESRPAERARVRCNASSVASRAAVAGRDGASWSSSTVSPSNARQSTRVRHRPFVRRRKGTARMARTRRTFGS